MITVHHRAKDGNFHQIAEAAYAGTEVNAKTIRLIIGGVIIEMSHDEALELSKAMPERMYQAHYSAPVELAKKPRKARKKTA